MKTRVQMVLLALAVVGALVAVSFAEQAKKPSATADHKVVRDSDLTWKPLIKGNDMAVLSGDPDKEGEPYVIRIRQAEGAKVPPHWHPADEYLTVLKGTFLVGMGETYDESKLQPVTTSNFIFIPREMRHFANCKGETIVQVHGIGPFKVNWVNPGEVLPPDKK
jgi:quercetin dioxygenase-like cupin family protein